MWTVASCERDAEVPRGLGGKHLFDVNCDVPVTVSISMLSTL